MSQKGALSLLAYYGGDSSDEEVPGCRVSVKRCYKDDEKTQNKRLERLPVPKFIVKDCEEAVVDNTSFHEGRIRSFPHERGNWATYAYIPYESNEGLQKFLETIKKAVTDVELRSFNDFHLSLTKTVILKHHWIDPFVKTMKEQLAYFGKFIVMIDSIEIYCNEEKTRSFIGLQIKTGFDSLNRIVNCLDNCLSEFKLPKFYENPSFHISIAWCLGDQTEKLKALQPDLITELHQIMCEYPQENWYIYVQQIMCKVGNKLYEFHLS